MLAVGNGYSSAQILSMQKDAIRRVNEMQRLSQERLRKTREAMGETAAAEPPSGFSQPRTIEDAPPQGQPIHSVEQNPVQQEVPQTAAEQQCPVPTESPAPASPFQGILDRIGLDKETSLVLMLLVLLVNEGADTKLIMALVYILL